MDDSKEVLTTVSSPIAPAQLRIESGDLDQRPVSGGEKQKANRDLVAAPAVWEQCVIQVALPLLAAFAVTQEYPAQSWRFTKRTSAGLRHSS
jgi:hypothetical protein